MSFLLCPTEGRKTGGQANLEGKKLRSFEGKPFTLKSLSSYPPTLLSSNPPSPRPSPTGEGAFRHSEAQRAERIQPIENNKNVLVG